MVLFGTFMLGCSIVRRSSKRRTIYEIHSDFHKLLFGTTNNSNFQVFLINIWDKKLLKFLKLLVIYVIFLAFNGLL